MNIYFTSDRVGVQTGGGQVTHHESLALKSLGGECWQFGRDELTAWASGKHLSARPDPWTWDDVAAWRVVSLPPEVKPGVAHFYAGTFGTAVALLKQRGWKATYTAAAHSVEESRREHEALGIPYNYPHLTDPVLWEQYLRGYLLADRLIVPSTHSRDVMVGYGADPRKVVIIPHGCDLPPDGKVRPTPPRFTVGYLGAYGPDKGVRYLLEAWKKLGYGADSVLLLGGRDAPSSWVEALVNRFYGPHGGCGQEGVKRVGWVNDVADFYGMLSCYVQPSVSEGFGIEVLEAMAHGRPVLCSTGAGAADCVPPTACFAPRDVDALANKIDWAKSLIHVRSMGQPSQWRGIAAHHTWDKVRAQYVAEWKELTA